MAGKWAARKPTVVPNRSPITEPAKKASAVFIATRLSGGARNLDKNNIPHDTGCASK